MKTFLKGLLIPGYKNNFYPYLIRKPALVFYTLAFLLFNLLSGVVGGRAYAGSISSSVLIELANKEREAQGLGELSVDPKLVSAAYEKAENIFKLQYWDHYGPNGETPWEFILGSGYEYVYAGENLAKGFNSSEAVHSAWMASKSHRENIMNPNYKDVGIAVVPGELKGNYVFLVVQMFGSTDASNSGKESYVSSRVGSGIEIIYPKDGDSLADKNFYLKGNAEGYIKNLNIYDNGVFEKDLICRDGVWDYRPTDGWDEGDHEVKVVDEQKTADDTVDFTVDTVAPEISDDSLKIEQTDDILKNYNIEVEVSGDPEKVTIVAGDVSEDLNKKDNVYSGKISYYALNESSDVRIIASDKVGNYSIKEITEHVLGTSSEAESKGSSIVGSIDLGGFVGGFNRVGIVVIIGLLVVDAIYLLKLNIISTRGKTLFPMAIWVLLMGVALVVGTGGSVV